MARHAKASFVEVTIESLEKDISMTIKDDGQGFRIGGTFRVDSAPGEPTTVQVELPTI